MYMQLQTLEGNFQVRFYVKLYARHMMNISYDRHMMKQKEISMFLIRLHQEFMYMLSLYIK